MLVTFRTKAFANITMFGDIAIKLLRLMGHSGTVPSAIEPEDIPAALNQLKSALLREEAATKKSDVNEEADDSNENSVSLENRALPLIQLLEAAIQEHVPVMWDT